MADRRFRLNLRVKLTAILLALSITPIVVLGYATYRSSEHFFRQSLVDSLAGLAKVKAQAIDQLIRDRISETDRMATLPGLVASTSAMTGKGAGERTFAYQALHANLKLLAGDGKRYEELFVAGPDGLILASTVYENKEQSVSQSTLFEDGMKTTVISNPFLSEITKKPSMVIATPIKDKQGKVVGVFGARLNLNALYDFIRLEKGLGRTGETVVGKKIGDEVVFVAPTRYDNEAALMRKLPAGSGAFLPLEEAARGADGNGFYPDYRGVQSLVAYEPVPALDWGLVVKMDAQESLEPILSARNVIALVTALLVLLAVLAASGIAKVLVGPLRELTEAADSISRGNLDVRLGIRSRDEVGDLASSFERMLAAIRFLKDQR